jgi:2'-5' RNA ligase
MDAEEPASIGLVAETAIVAEVPEVEAALYLTRRCGVATGPAGMPAHVTLLYPFTDSDHLPVGRIHEVRDVFESLPVFEVEFGETAWFENLDRAVLWLKPVPSEPFVAITEALEREFPEHPAYAGQFDSVIPHLTVATGDNRAGLLQLERDVVRHLASVALIQAAQLYEHQPGGWRLRDTFALREFGRRS